MMRKFFEERIPLSQIVAVIAIIGGLVAAGNFLWIPKTTYIEDKENTEKQIMINNGDMILQLQKIDSKMELINENLRRINKKIGD